MSPYLSCEQAHRCMARIMFLRGRAHLPPAEIERPERPPDLMVPDTDPELAVLAGRTAVLAPAQLRFALSWSTRTERLARRPTPAATALRSLKVAVVKVR